MTGEFLCGNSFWVKDWHIYCTFVWSNCPSIIWQVILGATCGPAHTHGSHGAWISRRNATDDDDDDDDGVNEYSISSSANDVLNIRVLRLHQPPLWRKTCRRRASIRPIWNCNSADARLAPDNDKDRGTDRRKEEVLVSTYTSCVSEE